MKKATSQEAIRTAKKARRKIATIDKLQPLPAEAMWRRCTLRGLDFSTSSDLEGFDGFIGQDRAVRALELGLAIERRKYNIYVSGLPGTGKTSAVKALLKAIAPKGKRPKDWVYVNDFKHIDCPYPVQLPSGRGRDFKHDLEAIIDTLVEDITAALHTKEHQERIQRTYNDSLERESSAFNKLNDAAQEHGFEVRSTKTGLVTIPIVDGEPVANKDFVRLPTRVRRRVERARKRLEPMISQFLETARGVQIEAQERIAALQDKLIAGVIAPRLAPLVRQWKAHKEATKHLGHLREDLIAQLRVLLSEEQEVDQLRDQLRQRYTATVVVDHSETSGAPVIFETNPTYFNLFGKIEKRVEQGMFSTDLSMIRGGAVAQASGGFLVLQTSELFSQPLAWSRLKSVLRNREVAIEDVAEQTTFVPTMGLRPKPIPVDVKVLLVGPPDHYAVLSREDPDFREIFRVKADFDSEVARTKQSEYEVAQFIAQTCRNDGLRHCTRDAIAAMVEEGSRMVSHQERLTLQFNELASLLIEADYHAGKGRSRLVRERHVDRAIAARAERSGLISERILEHMVKEQLLISTHGEAVGRVNGLAVLSTNDVSFGKPIRVSATSFAGKAGIINVEREARLSGRIHNKGVMILHGWLGTHFAQREPLSLTVNLTIEQSYGMIDGDSASTAELYAVLSSLAQVPVRQDLAVTGSVNQHGEVQSIGGVNEKIEGFYRLCQARRLTGRQGVLIPRSNSDQLMLRADVRRAVDKGRFHIYPVDHVDQGIELLTGMPMRTLKTMAMDRLRILRPTPRTGRKSKSTST